jgi:CheY-like chemotaxis protein
MVNGTMRTADGGPESAATAPADATQIGVEVAPQLRELADSQVGREIGGYRIEGEIGRGGMGVVYSAEHLHLQRLVALKLLPAELTRDEAFRARFVRESRLAAEIHHPNIVTVYDAGEADGLLYLAMQYVRGTDLAWVLDEHGPLEPERAVAVLEQVASALDAAHARGLVHRDVKPANVLLDDDHCYLTDFGLTKRRDSRTALTAVGQLVGTMDYVAPEQIEGGPLDARTDVYALGCVLYHCLAGKPPYQMDSDVQMIFAHLQRAAPSLAETRPDLPAGLDEVIATAMAKRPADRHASCGALAAAARAVVGGGTSRAAADAEAAEATRILVASAAPPTRALIRAALADDGRVLLDAQDGRSAIATALEERPRLVIVDADIADPPGTELCRALRADTRTALTRIIALTSRSARDDAQAMLAAGADEQLGKPFSALRLAVAARDLLSLETNP